MLFLRHLVVIVTIMDTPIGHADMNCFYAAVEMAEHPEYLGKAIAVCGDPANRHGIVLTASYPAKNKGVKTGMALWEAKALCPDLIFVRANLRLYMRYSRYTREIFYRYTDQVEPFGLDEAWLDFRGSPACGGDPLKIAQSISNDIKRELGITCSIGLSFSKVYAKLGSDYKKPDAITVFDKDNYRDLIFPLPASDLLYVGPATTKKLAEMAIYTIGDLATCDPARLQRKLGKMGIILHQFANGYGDNQVSKVGDRAPIKSVGNSWTTPRDLMEDIDAWVVIALLSESVCARMRELGCKCRGVEISVRDSGLSWFSRQSVLLIPTNITDELTSAAFALFKKHYSWNKGLRSLGVRGINLVWGDEPVQLRLDVDAVKQEELMRLDGAVDDLRRRYGFNIVQRAKVLMRPDLAKLDAKHDNIVHPHGYFGQQESCK